MGHTFSKWQARLLTLAVWLRVHSMPNLKRLYKVGEVYVYLRDILQMGNIGKFPLLRKPLLCLPHLVVDFLGLL